MKHQDDILFSRKLDRNDCSDVSKTWNIPVNTKYFVKDKKVMANIWHNADYVSFNPIPGWGGGVGKTAPPPSQTFLIF